jgi:hypothetical protein
MKPWLKLGVAVLGMVVYGGTLQAQTTLRYKFKEGDKFGYDLEQKMKMSSSVMGKDIEMNMNQSMTMSWQVLKVEPSGAAEVKIMFTGAKMTMDGPTGKVEVDSKNPKQLDDPVGKVVGQVVTALAGLEMTFTMDETGDIKDLKIPEKVKNSLKNIPGADQMAGLLSDEGLKKMAHGGIVLPKEAVTKGKSWTRKADMKMPMGQVKGDIQFTYEGPVEKNGKKLEKIAIKPNISLEPTPGSPFQMTRKSQDGKGYVYFDNQAGRMVEVDSDQLMEMTINANNMNINQKMDQHTVMKLVK